jgi:hypothetical protein
MASLGKDGLNSVTGCFASIAPAAKARRRHDGQFQTLFAANAPWRDFVSKLLPSLSGIHVRPAKSSTNSPRRKPSSRPLFAFPDQLSLPSMILLRLNSQSFQARQLTLKRSSSLCSRVRQAKQIGL